MRWTTASAALAALALAADPAFGALPRATADRLDDWAGRPQVHALYVVPSDGTDRALDTNGTIEASVDAFQRWLASQAGGRALRMDTFEGALDITFRRLSRTDAAIAASGPFVRDEIERELVGAGLVRDKLYAVWYDGSSTFACGGGAWPPTLRGSVAALYLQGRPPAAALCANNPFATPGGPPRYWDFAMLHELVHTLGFVATCAPHHTLAGHTSDDVRDLMYAGPLGWAPSLLDVGRDDYYGHSTAGCPDLEDSPFLTAAGEQRPAASVRLSRISHGPARAGRRFTVSAQLGLGGPEPDPELTCAARVGARSLRPATASIDALAAVRCAFVLPRSARGKLLAVTITVRNRGASASRVVRVRVRR